MNKPENPRLPQLRESIRRIMENGEARRLLASALHTAVDLVVDAVETSAYTYVAQHEARVFVKRNRPCDDHECGGCAHCREAALEPVETTGARPATPA